MPKEADTINAGVVAEAPTRTEMEAQIDALRAEVAKLSAQLQSSGQRSLGAMRGIAAEGIGQLRREGEERMEGLRDSARDLETQLVAAVRERPVTSLAVAAGVGFLLALISRR